jgi:hypothetical protein
MAHNLALTNGNTAMMYAGEVPWHQLGTKLDEPATARQAIEAAGLNFQVELKALATTEGTMVPQRKGVVRGDTNEVLGVVGNSYVPVQNYQAFGFLDAVVAEGGLRYHTAGALGKGERIWMLAKLPTQIHVRNSDDAVDKFLLLSNTHDGTTALRVYFTPIRVVCQNTLNLAETRGVGQGISIMQAKIEILAQHSPSAEQLQSYFESLYPDPADANSSRVRKVRENLTRLFETGIGLDMPEIKGTTWAAYNAVTEWVDHHRPTRSTNAHDRASHRLNSSWFGSGAKIKARAWNLACDMALSS